MKNETTVIRRVDSYDAFFREVGLGMARGDTHEIGCVNWPDKYPDRPKVDFAIAHTGSEICIKFFVSEQYTLARVAEDNGEVWTDSCVEFFINFDESGYYNFEFNCIGKMLLGFRKQRDKYTHASEDILSTIKRVSTLGSEPFAEMSGRQHWEMAVVIPVGAFFRHDIKSLSGLKARANFYKCGDNLTVPHYLSWNPVKTKSPDFHREEYFGGILFG